MKKLLTVLGALAAVLLTSTLAFAEGMEHAAASSSAGYYAIAAAIVMGLAAAVGTNSQSRAAAAALEGIARNPQARDPIFVPLILSLALMESLVILSFVIAFAIVGKI